MLPFVSVVFVITLVKYCLCTVEIRTSMFMLGNNGTATGQTADVVKCSMLCNLDNACSGFTVASNGICELTFSNDNVYLCSLESKLCYYEANFIQAAPCHVLIRNTAQVQAYLVYNHFLPGATVQVYHAFDALGDNIVNGGPVIATYNISLYYPDMTGEVDSWYYMTYPGYYYTYLFKGSDVEIHRYMYTGIIWKIIVVPRPIASEYGPSAPSSVDASGHHFSEDTVYLLQHDTVYQFNISGLPPACTYSFVASYELWVNSAQNPFSADVGVSVLPHAPRSVHTMYTDPSRLIVFAGTSVYQFDKATKNWENKGLIPCL